MTRPKAAGKKEPSVSALVDGLVSDLAAGKSVRSDLGNASRIHIDRPLPFLCVYREPADRTDKGTAQLILSEASYLIISRDDTEDRDIFRLIRELTRTLSDRFGAFLIVELWSGVDSPGSLSTFSPTTFRVFTDKPSDSVPSTVEKLAESLGSLQMKREVEIAAGSQLAPTGFPPLLDEKFIRQSSCLMLGIEISPVFRDPETGEIFLSSFSDLRRKFSGALQQAFFEFANVQTSERPKHPQRLGRRLLVDAAWKADAELSELSDTFNYLMAVTPVNSTEAFADFAESKFKKDPVFHYRLLTIDPEVLKRRLYSISFDSIEDPTMAYLLRDKRIELDRYITLIEDRNTPRFMFESLQLFPPVEDALMALAEEILDLPKRPAEPCERLGPNAIAEIAEAEIDHYRSRYPEMAATVEIRKDTPPGLMVSHGKLLIGRETSISTKRLAGLLQHEVGTHIVTYFNGRAQPLKLLYSGLPGYEQLQEGLAVFSEYLADALNFGRLRTLAARVVAVRRLTEGKKFSAVFNELRERGFGRRSAFTITMRVFRGGGLTKDAVYLRGLVDVLNYIRDGGDISTLFVGKMGVEHISIIRELQWREVLKPAPLEPRYMMFENTPERLDRIKQGASLLDLV